MSDQEIIKGLIERDNDVTEHFLFVKCRPLLTAIMNLVFSYHVEYDEMVNELYDYLMADNAAKLRQFEFRSSIYQWIKVVATRFFIRHRDNMIENSSKEPLSQHGTSEKSVDMANALNDKIDIERMLRLMDNRRYADVIRCLIIEDMAPERYAAEIGVTVDNLYNIKKRAMAAFTRIAIKYYSYGR